MKRNSLPLVNNIVSRLFVRGSSSAGAHHGDYHHGAHQLTAKPLHYQDDNIKPNRPVRAQILVIIKLNSLLCFLKLNTNEKQHYFLNNETFLPYLVFSFSIATICIANFRHVYLRPKEVTVQIITLHAHQL